MYWVYIASSEHRTLYTGVTNDLRRRMAEHRSGLVSSFSRKYNIGRLVYCESTPNIRSAIAREKQIKGWSRHRKVRLIEAANPRWDDLEQAEGLPSAGFLGPPASE